MNAHVGWLVKKTVNLRLKLCWYNQNNGCINLSMAIKDVLDFQSLPTFILVAMAIFFKGLVIFLGGKVTDMPFTLW